MNCKESENFCPYIGLERLDEGFVWSEETHITKLKFSPLWETRNSKLLTC